MYLAMLLKEKSSKKYFQKRDVNRLIIRKAKLDDASGIAKVHVDSWRTTYKSIIPNDYLEKLSYEQRTELWKRNISNEDNYVIIAETEKREIIGFADGWRRPTNLVENSSDLTSIYLLESYQGKGIGKKLIKEMFKYFKNMGYEKIFVEVLEDNNTRYFYERYGAKLVKTDQIEISGKAINELIYVWDNIDDVSDE